jgi:hypothetical protein
MSGTHITILFIHKSSPVHCLRSVHYITYHKRYINGQHNKMVVVVIIVIVIIIIIIIITVVVVVVV